MSTPTPAATAPVRIRAQAAFETRTLLSNGEQLLVSVVLPALALVGLTRVEATPLHGDVNLVTPGVLALAMVSTAFTGQAIATAFDRRYGLLRLLGVTPLGPRGLLAGKALAVLVVLALQITLLGGLAFALGWAPNLAGLPATFALVLLGTWAFVCLALALAGTIRAEGVLALANLIWVLLLVGGGLLIPTAALPAPLNFTLFLPSGALGNGLRQTLVGNGFPIDDLAILGAWALVGSALVAKTFRWSD